MTNSFKYMTEEDFYFIIEVLKDNIETYKKNNVHIRNFSIKLSNGKLIHYNLYTSTIAHILGVNTDYLYSLGIYKEKESYELLENLIYNPSTILELSKKGLIDFGILFSDKIFEKNLIFKELFTLDLNNMYFYSPLVTNKVSPESINYDYGKGLIAYKIDDSKEEYRIVTLSKRTHAKYRAISSHRYYDNKETFINDLLYFTNNQEISFVTEAKYYEKKDQNIYEIKRTIEELLENTKMIDELMIPNKVDVLSELKNKYSIQIMALEGIEDVFEAKDEYDMLKRLYKVMVKNYSNKTFTDDTSLASMENKEDNKL